MGDTAESEQSELGAIKKEFFYGRNYSYIFD
jgi:hypothetical protein